MLTALSSDNDLPFIFGKKPKNLIYRMKDHDNEHGFYVTQ